MIRIGDLFPIEFSFPCGLTGTTFDKRPVVSLYWFATQQEADTCSRQMRSLFYSKFNAQFKEVSRSF